MITNTPDAFLQIIRATSSDVPSIQRLHRALCVEERDNGYSANQDVDGAASPEGTRYVEGRVGGDGLALVARSNEAVVGYLLAGFRTIQGESAAGVESMFVPMEFRRRGIGSALMSAFLDWSFMQSILALALSRKSVSSGLNWCG